MKLWLWLGGGALFMTAAGAVFLAFQSPNFVAGLSALAAGAVWKAIAPAILRRKSPEEERLDREAWGRGERRADPRIGPRHPGER